ncbi:MAG: homocysteine S-methyltransferase family protein [Rhodospirillaceae bacterium]|nr:homocysteine S-methyltransferase family protein [Rhodospirillaceae bacterium]MBT7760331.1 homocysteine S-methyltransferase family protein [Rhodospirillaceae bacterium]
MIIDHKLAAGDVIVLDGAMGSEVRRYGAPMDSAAWCGVANKTHPNIVCQVHEDYIRAGADVITTNTFATCRHVLEGAGLGDETVAINRRAVELAREARDRVAADRPVAVAGSMSTMAAWVPGTISPDQRFAPTAEQEAANFHEMAHALADAGVDLIIMEMMYKLEDGKRAIAAALSTGLPVWIGISCTRRPDGRMVGWDIVAEETTVSRLVEGQAPRPDIPLETLIDEFTALGGAVAGIMHSATAATTPGLEMLLQCWSGPVMAYPEMLDTNSTDENARFSMSPGAFAEQCRQWVEGGVQIIGGCCGSTVEHIRQMVEALPTRVGPRP